MRSPFFVHPEPVCSLHPSPRQCAAHGIYTIIDLHAAAGGQNTDWHSDAGTFPPPPRPLGGTDEMRLAGTHKALFWEYQDFQDRTVRLWEWLAEVRSWGAGAIISADGLSPVSPSPTCPPPVYRVFPAL